MYWEGVVVIVVIGTQSMHKNVLLLSLVHSGCTKNVLLLLIYGVYAQLVHKVKNW